MSARVLQLTAGAGPAPVRRFVAQLADHLLRVCEAEGALVSFVGIHGAASEPESVEIHFAVAPPALESFAGTHALIGRSPERGKRSRKRWFAGVRVFDAPEGAAAEPIDPRDVEISAMRAGGPGGQHVNKTASAVRALHRPSGITVRVTDERSQRDNVRLALSRLARILADRKAARAREARRDRRLAHHRVERGRPAFTYEMDRKGNLQRCDATCSK